MTSGPATDDALLSVARPAREGMRDRPQRSSSAGRCFPFANEVGCPLIGPKAKAHRVAHFARRSQFGKFYFGHQRRLYPGGDGFILHLCGKRRLSCLERQKLSMKFFEGFVIEACADMSDVTPEVLLANGENERTEERARAFRRSKTYNDRFLPVCRFDLEPVSSSSAGHVIAMGPLSHNAFEAVPLGFLEEPRSESLAVTAECNQVMARKDCLELLFAFKQREPAQIVPIAEHEVEPAVEELRSFRSAFCSNWRCETQSLSNATSSPSITALALMSSSAIATSIQLWLRTLPLRLYSATFPFQMRTSSRPTGHEWAVGPWLHRRSLGKTTAYASPRCLAGGPINGAARSVGHYRAVPDKTLRQVCSVPGIGRTINWR